MDRHMRILGIFFSSLLIIGLPLAFARAQEERGGSAGVNASVQTEVRVRQTGTPPPRPATLPKLGPQVRELATSTRMIVKQSATTTREAVKLRTDAMHAVIGDRQEALQALMAERKQVLQERAAAAKERAMERFGEHVEKIVTRIVERLTAMVNRLINIADRIESRISKLSSEGYNMAQASNLLAEARIDIATASEKVAALSTIIEVALQSENPREAMADIREGVRVAQETLRTARESLKKVLDAIRVEVDAEASAEVNQ